ncbi:MAG: autotransporter domain-containing protein [Lysobacteraceae bacterium]|nr:MAG: autotransporter domain-containing protein [Xanthomonadaceae bacterium]
MKSVRPARKALVLALALAAAPAFAGEVYSETYFFGDSLTDSGHFQNTLPAGIRDQAGRFTTNPGWIWAQWVADHYGTDATTDNQGGTNYAIGGARIDTPVVNTLPVTGQVELYLANHGGRADPDALYTVWGGGNDLLAFDFSAPVGAQMVEAVSRLQDAGARYVLVPTVPDAGLTPFAISAGGAVPALATTIANSFNQNIFGALAAAGLRIIPLNTFQLQQEIVADAGRFGFTNIGSTACTGSSLTCTPADYVVPGADQTYVFADGVHPSSATHRILADYAVSVLEGPRQVAMLSNSAAFTGRARADRVAMHVDGTAQADGMRWWGDLRADRQQNEGGIDYDGTTPAGTFGLDWSRGDLVFGGFLGFGRGTQDYGRDAGRFDHSESTVGGFLGWYGESAWINGQASYSKLSFDVERKVNLGIASRRHDGSADGSNLSVGLNAGWEFADGVISHGPVAGVLAQRIEVDGYTEAGTLATALAHAGQDYDSLVANLGWQVRYAAGENFRPYARVTFDHEFEGAPDQVFARLVSMPATAEFAVPGLQADRSYGTVMLGARTRIGGLDANFGATGLFAQEGGTNATLFVTLSGGF